jgi:hypothetical protein
VTDGSFEDVDPSDLYVDDATSGGWTLSGGGYFETNSNNAYQTPYGSYFVLLLGSGGSMSSVSQPVALAPCQSGIYTLSYSYEVKFLDEGGDCTLSATYGGVTLDSFEVSDSTSEWATRTQVFIPAPGSGTISFTWACNFEVDAASVLLDNISVN